MTVPRSPWRVAAVGLAVAGAIVAGCGPARQDALPLAATRLATTTVPPGGFGAAAADAAAGTTTTPDPPPAPTTAAPVEPEPTTVAPAPAAAAAATPATPATRPAPVQPVGSTTAPPPATTAPPPTSPPATPAPQARTAAAPAGATRGSLASNPFAAFDSDQCTWYAEERMKQHTGLYMAVDGDAWQWPDRAAAAGWTVGTKPEVNSVVAFPAGSYSSPVGHVAWVVDVSGDQVRVQDYNWNFVGARVTDHWVGIVAGTRFIYGDR